MVDNMKLGIGIDTGGTFTDCAIVDLEQNKVIAKAKSQTTHANLRLGIARSMDAALNSINIDQKDIKAVSLSTTLATNALIEGRGARVGTILIGIQISEPLPSELVYFVKGGHTVGPDGSVVEIEPLDEKCVERACEDMNGKVEAVAIIESFGTLCPEHEFLAKKISKRINNLPVTCGHELTNALGFYERATTAAINSQLIPILSSFINAVETELKERMIVSPLFMVKSDGTLTTVNVAKERPVETILTGPAASVIGTKYLTGLNDFIMIDQGGTTCLTSIVKNGWPLIDEEGATIASYKTRVKALKLRAIGLGGDSHITVQSGNIEIGPRRLVPLCLASRSLPEIKNRMRTTGSTYYLSITDQIPELADDPSKIIHTIKTTQPTILEDVMTGSSFAQSSVEAIISDLINKGYVEEIGLTITDILHWEDKFIDYDKEASEIGIKILAEKAGLSEQEFVSEVENKVINGMCKEILLSYTEEYGALHVGMEETYQKLLNSYRADLHMQLFTKKPIIAAGACSYAFVPEVANRTHTTFIIPKDCDVCNAIGCIVGAIVERVIITVRRSNSSDGFANGSFQILYPGICESFANKDEAVEYAEKKATELAIIKAEKSGAIEISTSTEINDNELPIRENWTGSTEKSIWSSCEIKTIAVGKPSYWK
jgi:N-methylhydantoinase A/oxoprolinase/acetone carboxylase beta subunit